MKKTGVLSVFTLVLCFSLGAQDVSVPGVDKNLSPDKPDRIWVNLDYLGLFGTETQEGIPMVTSRIWDTTNNPNKPGIPFYWGELNGPGTRVLYGNDAEGYPWSHGFKGDIGGWIDADRQWAAELSGFYSPSVSDDQTFATNPLSRTWLCAPFYNINGYEDSVIIGLEDGVNGWDRPGAVKAYSEQEIWGIGASGYRNIVRTKHVDLDGLFGFRFVNFSEEMEVTYNQIDAVNTSPNGLSGYLSGGLSGGGLYIGNRAVATDRVETDNHFYGANLGVRFSMHIDRFQLVIKPQVALGAMDQNVDTTGTGLLYDAAGTLVYTSPGGVFARPGATGERSKTRFAWAPNVDVKLGVRICDRLAFNAGYTFLYLSDVARAGNQLDRRLNVARTGISISSMPMGVSRPLNSEDWMGHGVTAGFTIKF